MSNTVDNVLNNITRGKKFTLLVKAPAGIGYWYAPIEIDGTELIEQQFSRFREAMNALDYMQKKAS